MNTNNLLSLDELKESICNELITVNHLLSTIADELRIIKGFTNVGGDFEANIEQNASLINILAKLQKIDIQNIPPIVRQPVNFESNEQNNTFEADDTRNESFMDESH